MTIDQIVEDEKKTPRKISALNGDTDSIFVPVSEVSKSRKCTDIYSLIVFVLVVILLISLSGTFSVGTDINRFFYGYDKCGDTCGVNNTRIQGINCSGKDLTDKRIGLVQYHSKCPCNTKKIILAEQCVSSCKPPYQLIFHRCYPYCKVDLDDESSNQKQVHELLHAVNNNLTIITIMGFTGIVLSLVILVCFGFNVNITFWTLTIFQFVLFLTSMMLLWHRYMTNESFEVMILLLAMAATTHSIFLIVFIACFHNKFDLIFAVYEEAMNAVFRISSLLIQPLLTNAILVVTLTSLMFLMFLISSNEHLVLLEYHRFIAHYLPRTSNFLYILYTLIVIVWIYEFVDGCQTMIVAGAVSTFYFTRIKSNLDSSYSKSVSTLIRYHLGSVACGSLLVTIFSFMRGIAVYIVSKAYIQTAMHGTSTYKSTLVAGKLLYGDLPNTAILTGLNYLIMSGCSVLAILISVIVGILMNPNCTYNNFFWMGLVFGIVAAAFTACTVMGILNVASETIFMCFCEDRIANDGKNRPYYMSDKLQRKFEESKDSDQIENI